MVIERNPIPDPKNQVIPSAANLFKALFLVTALLASYYATQRGVEWLEQHAAGAWIKWTFIAAVSLWDGLLVIGMGVLAHDAIHKVLFRSLFWNEFAGSLLSSMALLPFRSNRQFHLNHHSYSHQPGLDPENEMHHYAFPVAAVVGPIVGMYAQYRIMLQNLFRFDDRRLMLRAAKDAFYLMIAAAVYLCLVPALGISLWLTVIPMLLLLPAPLNWRALSDHYGIPPVVRASKTADAPAATDDSLQVRQEVSGWVIMTSPWLEWLWSHVNYHEVHHKYPYVSHQYLPQVFAATREQYPYLVVDGYWKSLLNMPKRDYYAKPEEVQEFLTVRNR